jgi:imidazolonepropionase-like amidohydrolase
MPVGEMEMLLAAGLAPMEVIEAATRVSADLCGHGAELGTLEPGMLADVIVVDGDPLADLQAMSAVTLVIRSGEIAFISEGMLSAGE